MKYGKYIAIVCVFTMAIFIRYFFGPGGDGVIGSLTMKDGSHFKVIQRHNGMYAEPYTVEFYMKLPNEPWGWCYIDHEDLRWGEARMVHDQSGKSIKIYRGSALRAEYFTERQSFALYSENSRELKAPQSVQDPPY